MKEVSQLAQGGHESATICARSYLNAFSKRRQLLARSRNKMTKLEQLAPAVQKADRTILYSETKKAAMDAVSRLSSIGVSGAVMNSDMDLDERHMVFAAFEEGEVDLVAAPRLLDEGIDVPAADLAIIVASSRSRRQMIQRMGRVLRKKDDGRLARIAVLYVENIAEDPVQGFGEDFTYLIKDAAQEIANFPSSTSGKEICKYLNDWNQTEV